MADNSLIGSSGERKYIYSLFSEVFARKPERDLLNRLRGKGVLEFLGEFCDCAKTALALGLEIEDCLEHDKKMEEAGESYEGLFVIPVTDNYIPPVASAFANRDGNGKAKGAFSTTAEELSAIYELHGVSFLGSNEKNIFVFHPDHVATLFAFMAFLIGLEDDCKDDGDALKEITGEEGFFFKNYIENWTFVFLDEIIARGSVFYVMVANIAKSFLAREMSFFPPFRKDAK